MCIALDRAVCTSVSRHYVDVEVSSDLTRGMTVVDRLGVAADERNRTVWRSVIDRVPPAQVVWSIDNARWKRALYSALGNNSTKLSTDFLQNYL